MYGMYTFRYFVYAKGTYNIDPIVFILLPMHISIH